MFTEETFKSAAEKLSYYTDKHVDPDLGLSNILLDNLGKNICQMIVNYCSDRKRFYDQGDMNNIRFKGVFSTDNMVKEKPPWTVHNFSSFILNLGRKEHQAPTGHFVACLVYPEKILYVDPLGFPPPIDHDFAVPSIINFFSEEKNRKVFNNATRFQALNSKSCGLFALCYILAHEMRLNEESLQWYIQNEENKLIKNDSRAINIIKTLISDL